jgi:hypothetical protein
MIIQGIKDRVDEDGGLPKEAVIALTACQAAGYRFAVLNGETSFHHTPCQALFQAYMTQIKRQRHQPWEVLTRTQFGVAINVACDDLLKSRQLWFEGKRVRVYSGVEGPRSFYRRLGVGRTPHAE